MILPDFKDRNGRWVAQVKPHEGKTYWTTTGVLWCNMLKRCREGAKNPKSSYFGCYHDFNDFHEFSEWCQSQIGFDVEGYQLDKDILVRGNKVYSKDTCVFVPKEINSAFIRREQERGDCPIGVCWSRGKYVAQVRNGSTHRNLGYFDNKLDAFYAYKEAKEQHLKSCAELYKGRIDHRVYLTLLNYRVKETD